MGDSNIPSISTFYGITIYMYFLASEHNPSHIHAYYGGYNATIVIETGEILEGKLPNNVLKLVREWLGLHKEELQQMWDTQEFRKITPLDEEE